MRLSNICLLFTPPSCADCQHFRPIMVMASKEPFGRCINYTDGTDRIGYASCARLDQTKCGQGAVWFSPIKKKKKKSFYIPPVAQ
jgi:hypothetical protein